MVGHDWTEQERQLLKDNFWTMEYCQLMSMLSLSEDQIKRECRRLGLRKEGGRKCSWPTWAKTFLLENYQKIGDKELAEIFTQKDPTGKKWTLKMVERKRTHLGITRTKEQLSAIKKRNANNGVWRTEKSNAIRKAKSYPHGKVAVWDCKNNYPRIVVKHGDRMVSLVRLNWEKVNGTIPPNHKLMCRTNDRLNPSPENWELLSLEESARRVHENIKNISPEYYQSWVALKTLKQVITKYEKH